MSATQPEKRKGFTMRKRMTTLGLVAVLALAAVLVLAGCQSDDIHGKTLYSVSIWDGTSYHLGNTATITFGETDESWHYVPTGDGYEATGTWTKEDGNLVLTSSILGTTTLARSDDGSYYSVQGTEELFGSRYYLSEEQAQSYSNEYAASVTGRVREILESTAFTVNSSNSQTVEETIAFADGSANFTKGEYAQEGYLFLQGPAEGSWTASDHTGDYSVTVDTMRRTNMGSDAEYTGTLTIGSDAVEYKLALTDSGRVSLSIERLTFTNS